mgnify:CR=1 FL=1
MLNATSNDAALIGKGSIDIDLLKNNKAYENLVGAKAWNAYVNKKDLQLVDLQINKQINLNPTSLIKNKEALANPKALEQFKNLKELNNEYSNLHSY